MSSVIKKLSIMLLISLSLIQILIYNKSVSEYTEANEMIYVTKKESKLYNELNKVQGKDIISAKKDNSIWNFKVRISGDKEKIKSEIQKLNNVEILGYSITKNNEENCVIVEISGK